MKVCYVLDTWGPVMSNGTIVATQNFINYLKSKGHTVYECSGNPELDNDPNGYRMPLRHVHPFDWALRMNEVELDKPNKAKLRDAISKSDVVMVQLPFSIGRSAINIAKELNKPVMISFHCQAENVTAHIFAMNNMYLNRTIYRYFYKKAFKKVDTIHYPTRFIQDLFERTVKHSTPGTVISNGVTETFYKKYDVKKNDKFTIVCGGRYSREKCQKQLLKAVSLSKYKDNICLKFAGSGPYKKRLQRLANKYKLDASFNYYSREDLAKLYQSGDLYVHTALIEIEAISCLEAITSGLVPVICNSSRSATPGFALTGQSLYKPMDAKNLCSKIEYWYEHPEVLQIYKEKYLKNTKGYKLEDCMERMEALLIKTYEKGKRKN